MVAGRPPQSFCVGPTPTDVHRPVVRSQQQQGQNGIFPSFMNTIVTPFMNCWQPPINPCVGTSSPMRTTGPPQSVVVSPVVDRYTHMQNAHIREPHPNDVLCGRGGSSNRHVGNLNFRSLVSANKELYVTLTKKQKMMVARKIVKTIHYQEPPGRFLQKDPKTGLWFDIGMPRSLEKTSQALREKTAPLSPTSSTTLVAEESLSDPGTPSLSKSPPASHPSSPVQSSASSSNRSTASTEAPSILIPEHLEAQFRPKRLEVRPTYPHRPLHMPQHPYLPVPAYPAKEDSYHPRAAYPPPPPPSSYVPPIDHRDPHGRPHSAASGAPHYHHRMAPPHPYPSSVPPQHPHHYAAAAAPLPYHAAAAAAPLRAPSTPDRRHPHPMAYSRSPDHHYATPTAPAVRRPPPHQLQYPDLNYSQPNHYPPSTPDRAYSQDRQYTQSVAAATATPTTANASTATAAAVTPSPAHPPPSPSKSSSKTPVASDSSAPPAAHGRPSGEVSPGRAQAWKKRRTAAADSATPSDKFKNLSIKEVASPSGLLQSRSTSRLSVRKGEERLAGLAALSSAALLKLDEKKK